MADGSQHPASSCGPETVVERVVLDTHVVMDWLWFEDPRVRLLGQAIEAGHLQWMATADMRSELERVLVRLSHKGKSSLDKERVLTSMDRWACWVTASVPSWRFQCTDPDDQKFIDLALHGGARWLLSRDRAVLKLRARAREMGCEFTTPEAVEWPALERQRRPAGRL